MWLQNKIIYVAYICSLYYIFTDQRCLDGSKERAGLEFPCSFSKKINTVEHTAALLTFI